jgi:hypothetical protein
MDQAISKKNAIIRQSEVEDFINQYESNFNAALAGSNGDVDSTVNSFASEFIEASPLGVIAGKNNGKFKESITKGWAFYKQVGISAMNIFSKQVTILDQFHAIVKVGWNCSFTRKDGTNGEIAFDIFYLIQKKDGIRIFAYITGDEQQALKDAGLTP